MVLTDEARLEFDRTQRIDKKTVGGQAIVHYQTTKVFGQMWHDMILKAGVLTCFYSLYQMYIVIQKTGLALSPVIVFELFGLGLTISTLFMVLKDSFIAKRCCLSLVIIQVYGYSMAWYDRNYPNDLDESSLAADFSGLSDEQWPLGSCFFFISWGSDMYLQSMIKQAHKMMNVLNETAAAASASKSKSKSDSETEATKEAKKDK